jgi:hypothetical protein
MREREYERARQARLHYDDALAWIEKLEREALEAFAGVSALGGASD